MPESSYSLHKLVAVPQSVWAPSRMLQCRYCSIAFLYYIIFFYASSDWASSDELASAWKQPERDENISSANLPPGFPDPVADVIDLGVQNVGLGVDTALITLHTLTMTSTLPPIVQAFSGAIGSVSANTLTYPLDLVTTRLQLWSPQKSKRHGGISGAALTFRHIFKDYGIEALYDGLWADSCATLLAK